MQVAELSRWPSSGLPGEDVLRRISHTRYEKFFMKRSVVIASTILLLGNSVAAVECRDADGNAVDQAECSNAVAPSADRLPQDAAARVYDLNAEARFFTAIGFHKQSRERRDEIARIYNEHGVPVPDEYK